MIGEFHASELQQVAEIIDEGVDVNIQRWDDWKQKNVAQFVEEINQARLLYRPFLHCRLGNYIVCYCNLILRELMIKQGKLGSWRRRSRTLMIQSLGN